MATSEALVVVVAINGNVLLMSATQLLYRSLDVLHTALNTHILGREVAVEACAVPVTGDRLRVQRHLSTVLLSNTGKEVSCNPKFVAHYTRVSSFPPVIPCA
jgi:hypothetical protein